jgi:hypothetical protein
VLVASIVGSSSSKYGSYTFGTTAHVVGFVTVAVVLMPIPTGLVMKWFEQKRRSQVTTNKQI